MPNRCCSRGHKDKPVGGVCPRCLEIYEAEMTPRDLPPVVIEPTVECRVDYFPDASERG
jgi:hypothetical protein